MKTLAVHIQETFSPIKEDLQTVVENLNDKQEEVVKEDEFEEKEGSRLKTKFEAAFYLLPILVLMF